MKPVAVTGIGIVSPLGAGPEIFFDALAAGRSGIRRLEGRDHDRLADPIGAPAAFDGAVHFDAPRLRMLDRATQLGVVAARAAVSHSQGALEGLDPERVGVSIGTGSGGANSTDDAYRTLYGEGSGRLHPFCVLQAMNNAAAAWIASEYGLTGPNMTYSTACSSSAVAIGEAARRVARGEVDVMIAGGAEAPLNFGTLKAWEAMRTLAPADPQDPGASCKPFARDRAGLVLGEGAAMLVLESAERARRRRAYIHAEITGYGLTTDSGHLTRPSVEGQARALRAALRDAELDPSEVDYVNAHGTGTVANDGVETAAIKAVFAERARTLPVSSTKSMHGHLLGAAGAVELVASILALARGVVPPTINLRCPDPECDLDYVADGAREARLRAALSSSFAFGGTNVVLAARRFSGERVHGSG